MVTIDLPTSGISRAPAGTPYHLLQRNQHHRWWRPLLGIVLLAVLICAFLFVGVGAGLLAGSFSGVEMSYDGTFLDPVWAYTSSFAVVALLLPPVLLTARWAHRRPGGTVSSVAGRLRWGWLLRCLSWAVLGLALIAVFEIARGALEYGPALWPGWSTLLTLIAISLLVVPLQCAAEEYLCRGFLLQGFAAWFRTPWPGAVVSALLFVFMHGYDDPLMLFDLFLFSMALSWLTIRTGGLEAAVALHVANNLTSCFLELPRGIPTMEQSGDYAVLAVLPGMLLTLVYTWWINRQARKDGIRCTSTEDDVARQG